MENQQTTKVITGIVRFCYAHVWEPAAVEDGKEKKYSVTVLIPKTDKATLTAIKDAIVAAREAGKSVFGGKIPTGLKLPLRDGDAERADEDPTYKGCFFINASSKTKPGIVDAKVKPIMNQDEFYSGCYGRASITFFAFNKAGNKGVAAGLNHVMKTKDGEPLGGRSSVDSDFAEFISDNGVDDADDLDLGF